MNNIGKEIKELREYLGLNQSQLSELSGVTRAAISQIESNQREPALDTIKRICEALKVCPSYLFRDKNKKLSPIEVLEHRNLSDHDKEQLEKFAQFLEYSKTKTPKGGP